MKTFTQEELDRLLDEDSEPIVQTGSPAAKPLCAEPSATVEAKPTLTPPREPPAVATSSRPGRRREDCLYLDFETIPDESRMHLFDLPPVGEVPPLTPDSELLSSLEFISQDIKEASAWISKKNPPGYWYEAVERDEKAGKNRKGMLQLLEDRKKQIDALAIEKSERNKLLSVTPLFCRIVAIGWAIGNEPPRSLVIDDPADEAKALNHLWMQIQAAKPIVGYGIAGFDIPVLLNRSMILGVKPTRVLDRRKYGANDIHDLYTTLYDGGYSKGFGLKPTCRMLGMQIPADDCDGGKVYDLYQQGDFEAIGKYVRSDVQITQNLHRLKMAGYFCL